MDYKKHYNLLINSRKKLSRIKNKNEYFEQHHIIPKSMGGNNNKDNLILLTPREHFLSHWLLYRIYRNRATASAFYRMCQKGNNNMKRYIPSSRIYEEARLAYIKENKNKSKHTKESKKAIGDKNRKSKPEGYKEKFYIPIIQLDLNNNIIKEWSSAKVAGSELGIFDSNINSCCNNRLKTYKNFKWKYKWKQEKLNLQTEQ
jgi:5-methylcytosine-specific restriction endonuclease McrA